MAPSIARTFVVGALVKVGAKKGWQLNDDGTMARIESGVRGVVVAVEVVEPRRRGKRAFGFVDVRTDAGALVRCWDRPKAA